MTPQQRRNYWLDIAARARKISDLADQAQEVEVGDVQKHEHITAVKINAEAAAIKASVDELSFGLEES